MSRTVALVLLIATSAWAQPRSPEKYDWNEVIVAAKKEGKVVVAGSPDPVMRNEVIPKFTARTGIALEFIAADPARSSLGLKRNDRRGFTVLMYFWRGPIRRPSICTAKR